MTDAMWRLAWALPLVLVLGVLAILVIKHVIRHGRAQAVARDEMSLRQSLQLSSNAQAHLVSVGTRRVLIVESGGQPAIHVFESAAPPRAWPLPFKGRST